MTNPASPTPPKRRGCFFYGCVTCLVISFIIGITVFFGVRHVINSLNATIAEYTDTNAMALPKVEMPADELKKLHERIDAFDHALKAHSNAPPLVLTGRDINALLASSTNLNNLKDRFYVALEGDQVKGQMSLPLGDLFKIPLIHTKGRFLNGAGTFKAAVTNGSLFVTVRTLEVKGKPLPDKFMGSLQQQNIAANFNNSTNSTILDRCESMKVTNGTIIIKAKPN